MQDVLPDFVSVDGRTSSAVRQPEPSGQRSVRPAHPNDDTRRLWAGPDHLARGHNAESRSKVVSG
jgi:hypothetical protein